MTTQNVNSAQLPELSLTLYVDTIVQNALAEFEILKIREQIDQALDEGNRSAFYELTHKLNVKMSRPWQVLSGQ